MNKKVIVIIISLSAFTISCLNTNKIQQIECVITPNGEDRMSESFHMEMRAKHKNGVVWTSGNLADIANGAVYTQGKNGSSNYFSISNYDIEVTGGKREMIDNPKASGEFVKNKQIPSDIVIVNPSHPPKINRLVKIDASVKKRTDIAINVEYWLDYKGRLIRNYNSLPEEKSSQVFIHVSKIHDATYFNHFGCDVYQLKIESNDHTEYLLMSEKNSQLDILMSRGSRSEKEITETRENNLLTDTLTLLLDSTAKDFVNVLKFGQTGIDGEGDEVISSNRNYTVYDATSPKVDLKEQSVNEVINEIAKSFDYRNFYKVVNGDTIMPVFNNNIPVEAGMQSPNGPFVEIMVGEVDPFKD